MRSIIEEIKQWIVKYQNEIILVAGVILISLLSFAAGYIAAKQQEKEQIKIEQNGETFKNSNYWGGNNWSLFGLETFRKRS